MFWRKERDSNPRQGKTPEPDFESGAFDHSAIFPRMVAAPVAGRSEVRYCNACVRFGRHPLAQGQQKRAQTAASALAQHGCPSHVGAQRLGDADAAVGLLVILQHRHKRAAHSQAGAVKGVQQFGFSLRVTETRLHAPSLEGFAIAD